MRTHTHTMTIFGFLLSVLVVVFFLAEAPSLPSVTSAIVWSNWGPQCSNSRMLMRVMQGWKQRDGQTGIVMAVSALTESPWDFFVCFGVFLPAGLSKRKSGPRSGPGSKRFIRVTFGFASFLLSLFADWWVSCQDQSQTRVQSQGQGQDSSKLILLESPSDLLVFFFLFLLPGRWVVRIKVRVGSRIRATPKLIY